MRHGFFSQNRRLFVRATLVAVICNFLVPVGYMPAALADGGPVKLCPSGWPMGAVPGDAGHNGHDDHQGHDGHSKGADAWEHCSYGAASSSPALVAEHELAIARVADKPVGHFAPATVQRRELPAFQSRAPPSTTPLSR